MSEVLDQVKQLLTDFKIHDPTSAETTLRTAILLLAHHLDTELAVARIEMQERVS